jgi:hypothetical protein
LQFAHPFDKITEDVHKFGLQLKESLLAEFDNDDGITSEDKALVHNDMGHFWSRFGSGTTTYTYRCNHCQHISQTNLDFMEITLPFPQARLSMSLNDLLNHDFRTEHMDNRLCKKCNNSNTSEVTTSIHTHPDISIIMLQRTCWNNNSERINTRVNFPVSGFIQNQGLDNDEMHTEYDLFAAVCRKESRNKTSGHFTAQCKIKGSNGYWIEYNDIDFELNYFINSRTRIRAKVKYHPLAYFLSYITRDPAVSRGIQLQVQENNGVSQSHAKNHEDERNHGDLVSNELKDILVHEDINQVDGTALQTTVINIDDDLSTEDDNLLTCTLCPQKINTGSVRGYADTEGQCQCLHDYH